MDAIMVEEWRGLRLRVIEAANPKQIGLEGVLVDEGVSQLAIRCDDGRVRQIPKSGTRLQTVGGSKKMIINAGEALMRSEDRTKRLYRKIMKK